MRHLPFLQKSSKVWRILSIDGGGIRGVFSLSLLAAIEESINSQVVNYFDLIAGTSTGGIIALALGLGYSATEVLRVYEQAGPRIFSAKGHWALWALRRFGLASYDNAPLREVLESMLGDRRLGESVTRLVIPATNLLTGESRIYRTPHHPLFATDAQELAVDVALATSAAPIFFPVHCTPTGACLIDGGIWAINPVGLAVVEALGVLRWPKERIRVLSLGSTSGATPFAPTGTVRPSLRFWIVHGITLALAAQSSAALRMALTLLDPKQIVRINPMVEPGRFDIDKVTEIPALIALGRSEAHKFLPLLRETFFRTPTKRFQAPYRPLNRKVPP